MGLHSSNTPLPKPKYIPLPLLLILVRISFSSIKDRSMGLRDIESTLPPGFRFYPSDEELVCHYLFKKVTNERVSGGTMVEVDLHTREPWELPEGAKLSANEWYFFSFRDRKYATGSRTNRATKTGYWKATGKDRIVHEPTTHAIVGMRKTLVFYGGRAPNGIKTGWVMHEFRLENPHMPPKEDWVLCRVFHKRKGETLRFGMEHENDGNYYGSSSPPNMEPSSPPQTVIDHQGMLLDCYNDHQNIAPFPALIPYGQDENNNNCSSSDNHNSNNPDTLVNLAVLHYNFLDFPTQDMDNNSASNIVRMGGSRSGDDYGFLLEMGLGDHVDHDMAEHDAAGGGIADLDNNSMICRYPHAYDGKAFF